jgi:hypothetical protein
MSNLTSQARRIPDYAATTLLRDPAAPAITATTNGVALSLDPATVPYWSNKEIPFGDFGVAFHATAFDRTTGDETAVFSVEVSVDQAFTVPIAVGATPVLTSGGYVEVPVSGHDLQRRVPNAAWIRVRAVLAGTTPIVTYGAWLYHQDK